MPIPESTYTSTNAVSGSGTRLLTGSPLADCGEIVSIRQTGRQNRTDDATNLQSPAEEFIATLRANGQYALQLTYEPGVTSPLETNFLAKTTNSYTLQLPKGKNQATIGDAAVFDAIVEGFNDLGTVEAGRKVMGEATLKVSGDIQKVLGS